MKMKEIIALTMAGYKKKDIDELLALEVDDPEEKQKDESEEKPKDESEENPKDESEEKPKDESEDETDYKSLYEETLKKLKVAQKDNAHKDINTDEESDDDILVNMVKDFM